MSATSVGVSWLGLVRGQEDRSSKPQARVEARRVPRVVSAGSEVDDPQDHVEREEWFRSCDGTQDTGLGAAFGEPLASEGEAGSAEQRTKNSDHSCEDALLLFEFC
jgi:hypothetical protein